MSIDKLQKSISGAPVEPNERVKKYLEKGKKSTRKLTGVWHWITVLLMVSMVLTYFYSSGISPLSAQMHRGVYVLLTFALVFIFYPVGSRWLGPVPCLIMGTGLAAAASIAVFFGTLAAFDARVVMVKGAFQESSMAAALFGSISGSAIANTLATGAFTIPMMKRAGFRAHVAGAIEPAASIGGIFVPPALGEMEVMIVAAHQIVYWFSQDSNITPTGLRGGLRRGGHRRLRPLENGLDQLQVRQAALRHAVPLRLHPGHPHQEWGRGPGRDPPLLGGGLGLLGPHHGLSRAAHHPSRMVFLRCGHGALLHPGARDRHQRHRHGGGPGILAAAQNRLALGIQPAATL